MSEWSHRPRRLAVGIGASAALLFVTSFFANDAVPREASPHFAAPGAGALEPGAVSSGAVDAKAQWTAALTGPGLAAARLTAEGAAATPALDPSPSPLLSTSVPPPVEPFQSDEPVRDCSPHMADSLRITDTSPAPASIEISKAAFDCAHEVGLTLAGNPAAISTLASQSIEGPLLLADSDLSDPLIEELRRLEPERVVAVGIDEELALSALPEFTVEHVEVGAELLHDRLWIVDGADDAADDAATLAAITQQVGVGVVAATGDLRALHQATREALSAASEVEVLSDLGEDAAWQLEVVRRGEELPGGGLLLFEPGDEGPGRRLVAVYGHPSTSSLGVLGEQEPEAAVERLRSVADGYGADGSAILPTFEIIATVASASPGADGDYSSMTGHEVIRPWIEAAAANDVYVVLDLQPGRSDFLSQAKHYEEFLRLPHVGLALDPEWRLKPDQVHLAQIGTVDAAEINRVVDWLAGIVREEALPQKLLIVHQFRLAMITNREQIETPPELAVLIHMDGQGSLTAKYNTWNALTGRADADRFHWGWKNFYDEDSPMAAPEQVLELSPNIVFVSFQ